jgi:hypothetical protein
MDGKRLSAAGVVLVPFLINVLANVFYDVVKANVGTIADAMRSPWFPTALFVILAAIWLAYWVISPAWRSRSVKPEHPQVVVEAEVATGTGTAHGAEIHVESDVKAVVTPGPWSPTLPQASFATKGRRHFAFDDFHRQPRAVRFSKPVDRLVTRADLPADLPCGRGRLVVEKFYAEGLVLDEVGTIGDPVAFVAYLEDEGPS